MIEHRFEVVSRDHLESLADTALPVSDRRRDRVFYRDVYLDTSDDPLQRRDVSCRLRVGSDDRRTLSLFMGYSDVATMARYDAPVEVSDPDRAVRTGVEPARRLEGIVDLEAVEPRLTLHIERVERLLAQDEAGQPTLSVLYDAVRVEAGSVTRSFWHLTVRASRNHPDLPQVTRHLEAHEGLRRIDSSTPERARLLIKWMEREQRLTGAAGEDQIALIVHRDGDLGFVRLDGWLGFPMGRGTGTAAARRLASTYAGPTGWSACRYVGRMSSVGMSPACEVWTVEVSDVAVVGRDLEWLTQGAALLQAHALQPDALAALAVGIRAGTWASDGDMDAGLPIQRTAEWAALLRQSIEGEAASDDVRVLNAERSILAFCSRVLELAEDARTPLGERLRYLAIVSANLDEFFMVRVPAVRQATGEPRDESGGGALSPSQQLDLIAADVRGLIARQVRCHEACALELQGTASQVIGWQDLDEGERAALRDTIREDLLPALTPMAMTLSPGHPFPYTRHLSLALAVTLRDRAGGAAHFAQVEIPDDAPRFFLVPSRGMIPVEEVVRANLHLVYPSAQVEQAYAFRVTRGADLQLEERKVPSLIDAVKSASTQRFEQPVVRVEVEQVMPPVLRTVLLRELSREAVGSGLDERDMYEVDGLLDLTRLTTLPVTEMAAVAFPSFEARDTWREVDSIWNAVAERDWLMHHPFDSFDGSVGRFFQDAARDPDVSAIKATLYRGGDASPVVDALVAAAAAGKDVVVFVELKARFDEERNVEWARRLEAAGGRVVHGFVGLKTHAKVALVVRREGARRRRYAHIGTGNYNAATARRYTDLSLFTAEDRLTADVQDLFNQLTGSSQAPEELTHGCLLSPRQLLPALISRIEREASCAREGGVGRIRMKLNGLTDPDVIEALYRASQDGVDVDLVIRGVCTLRPGVPGLSDRIRVISVLGRFLEHSRIYHFGTNGRNEYYIGSADARPRNLRRRVELLAPVTNAAVQAELGRLLDLYVADGSAWELQASGEYRRRVGGGPVAQEVLLRVTER